MKKFILSHLFFCLALLVYAQPPAGYYNTATGTGYTLKTQLHNIIKNHTDIGYGSLWSAYAGTYQGKPATDKRPDGKVWDMYSNCNFTFVTDQDGGSGGANECEKFNREHTVPQSWFSQSSPMVSDLFHIPPTDKKVNNIRSNFPYGTVANPSQTTGNGSKLGPCSFAGYSGTVFEPIDTYKGDFARIYFYMATRYENVISSWQGNSNEANAVFDGTSNKVFETWQLNLLYQWHIQDPVSQKEIDRNNAIYQIQGNRNPYIDNPQWVANVWGFSTTSTYTLQFSTTANSIAEGNSGNTAYSANVSISPALPTGSTATVQVSLGTGTATSGTDFNFTPLTLTFNSTTSSQQVSLNVVGDTQLEPNETVVLNLTSPSANAIIGANATHTLTINNDDTGGNPVVQFTAVSGSVAEGNTGTTNYTATVSISPALSTGSATVQVSLGTSGTTATSGTDFNATPTLPATLTFTPSTSSQTITIVVAGDTQIEDNEFVRLELSNPTGLVLGTNTAHTLTINNEDINTTPTINFETLLGEVPEGNTGTNSSYNVFVTISPAPTANATVQVSLGANTTATNNTDFQFTPLTLNFSPTVTTRSVSLTITGDNTLEDTEIVELVLQNPTGGGAVLGTNTVHTVNIDNDEPTAIEAPVLASQIQVYPNPTQDQINIKADTNLPIQSLHITDLRGKTVQNILPALPTKDFSVSLKDLPKGIYIFALQVGKHIVYKKVVKF